MKQNTKNCIDCIHCRVKGEWVRCRKDRWRNSYKYRKKHAWLVSTGSKELNFYERFSKLRKSLIEKASECPDFEEVDVKADLIEAIEERAKII